MDQLGIGQNSLIVAYDFTNNPNTSTGYILPTSWSSGCYTGIANGSIIPGAVRGHISHFMVHSNIASCCWSLNEKIEV